jgi:hypothetical protein
MIKYTSTLAIEQVIVTTCLVSKSMSSLSTNLKNSRLHIVAFSALLSILTLVSLPVFAATFFNNSQSAWNACFNRTFSGFSAVRVKGTTSPEYFGGGGPAGEYQCQGKVNVFGALIPFTPWFDL